MVREQRCRWCAGQVRAVPLVAAQLFDTSPGNGQCRALDLALPRRSAGSVGCRALDAGGVGRSVFIVCNPVF